MKLSINDIRTQHVGKTITVTGQIQGASQVYGTIQSITYKCKTCGQKKVQKPNNQKISTPKRCVCNHKNFKTEKTEVQDAFSAILEETPENVQTSLTQTYETEFCEELTRKETHNKVNPGVRVEIEGTIQEHKTANGNQWDIKTRRILKARNIKFLTQDNTNKEITQKDMQQIQELSQKANILSLLAENTYPLAGLHEEKKILTLQLLGGTRGNKRNQIHILLIGDPSVGKTTIAKQTKKILPNSQYISGGSGCSTAGFIGGAEKDSKGHFLLISGAIPKANGAIAIVDELDGIKADISKCLNEVMEEGQVHITKIVKATLQAKTGLLLCANPKNKRLNPFENIASQITIPSDLLSRVDITIVMKDEAQQEKDKQIFDTMLGRQKNNHETIKFELLKQYINHARKLQPQISTEAYQYLQKKYVEIRQSNKDLGFSHIPITSRDGLSIVRLSEAVAKSRLSTKVEKQDAETAMQLKLYSLKQTSLDKDYQIVNVDNFINAQDIKSTELQNTIKTIIETYKEGVQIDDLYTIIQTNKETIDKAISQMKQKGDIYEPKPGRVQTLW